MGYKNSIIIITVTAAILTLGTTFVLTAVPAKPKNSSIIEALEANGRFTVDTLTRTKEEAVENGLVKIGFAAEGKCKRELVGLCKAGEQIVFGLAEDGTTIDGWIVFQKTTAGWAKHEGNTWPIKKQ